MEVLTDGKQEADGICCRTIHVKQTHQNWDQKHTNVRLTEFRDAAHPGGQQALLHGAELGLTEGRPLAALRRSLLSVQSQALRQAEHT